VTVLRPGLLLDRDGVLISDVHLLVEPSDVILEPGAADAIRSAQIAGLAVAVVTNQTVVSRGLCSEEQVTRVNRRIEDLLAKQGCKALDGFYVCPHHPNATVGQYRIRCHCRKPEPGLLLHAAQTLALDLQRTFLVGDRPSDILAGQRAGCRTVLVTSGRHLDPPIVGVQLGVTPEADFTFSSLLEAMPTILEELQR